METQAPIMLNVDLQRVCDTQVQRQDRHAPIIMKASEGATSRIKTASIAMKSDRRLRLLVLLVGIMALTASRYSACREIYKLWLSSKDFNGLWLVPLFACIVIWQRREKLLGFQWKAFFWTLIPLGVIVIFQLFGQPAASRGQIVLLIVSMELLTLTVIGWQAVKHITAPLLLSVLTIPPPGWLWLEITLIMQYLSLKVSMFIYGLFAPISCEGFSVFLHTCQKLVVVGPECSGVKSLLGLCIVCWSIILQSKARMAARLMLALSVLVIAFFFNVCRIVLTVLLGDHGLEEYAIDFWHGLSGIIVFLLGILTLTSLIWLIESGKKPHQSDICIHKTK